MARGEIIRPMLRIPSDGRGLRSIAGDGFDRCRHRPDSLPGSDLPDYLRTVQTRNGWRNHAVPRPRPAVTQGLPARRAGRVPDRSQVRRNNDDRGLLSRLLLRFLGSLRIALGDGAVRQGGRARARRHAGGQQHQCRQTDHPGYRRGERPHAPCDYIDRPGSHKHRRTAGIAPADRGRRTRGDAETAVGTDYKLKSRWRLSCSWRAAISSSSSPIMIRSRQYRSSPIRWSVHRFCGKL